MRRWVLKPRAGPEGSGRLAATDSCSAVSNRAHSPIDSGRVSPPFEAFRHFFLLSSPPAHAGGNILAPLPGLKTAATAQGVRERRGYFTLGSGLHRSSSTASLTFSQYGHSPNLSPMMRCPNEGSTGSTEFPLVRARSRLISSGVLSVRRKFSRVT